jgi:glyoxylase-like metal-dependent hydrolase (beta-lactamase superfamily II)
VSDYPILSWKVGEARITKVVECVQKWPFSALLPEVTEELLATHDWLAPFVHDDGRMLLSFHALVVESQGRTILVDTCIGNDKDRTPHVFDHLQTPFIDDLAAAGFAVGDVDTVFCTHLHVDHVGWNTTLVDGRWVPTFPRARYLLDRSELDYLRQEPQDLGDIYGDSVEPVLDAGMVDFVEADHRLTDEVWLEATPGHTPGHHSVRIRSAGADAVITGDMTHHPVQMARPDICSTADWRPEMAAATRRQAYERWGTDTLVIGTHFAAPTAGRLERDGDAWRLVC